MANTCSDASSSSSALVGASSGPSFARSSDASGPERRYVVQPYDTLWSIAAGGYSDPREGVWEITASGTGSRERRSSPARCSVLP